MIERFNFTLPTVPPLEGYTPDIGQEYDSDRGYGWITQESVGSENIVPLDITENTRDRNTIEEEDLDSLIHLQYEEDFSNPNSVETPAAWQYDLENGQYVVTVAVGDPDFIDSNHVINIEGETVISGFMPSLEQLFEIETSIVEVTDGTLTVDAIGGENTKLNFIEIAPNDGSEFIDPVAEITPITIPDSINDGGVVPTVQPIDDGININFGAPTVSPPEGFIQDVGQAYNEEQGYGWVTQESAGSAILEPLDLVANGRDRNILFTDESGELFREPVLDSLMHMQYPESGGYSEISDTTSAAWEYDLDNGEYEVTVSVGDPEYFDSNHVINIEGESVISGFVPTPTENGIVSLDGGVFATGTATVAVEDGRLTVDAIGGENTKINYISIVPVESDAGLL